jgi:3-dehydroquinate synthase
MVMANALAVELGLMNVEQAAEVKALLAHAHLPTDYTIKDINDFYEHFFLDKKSANNTIKFILPEGIGGHKIIQGIEESVVKKVLAMFGEE